MGGVHYHDRLPLSFFVDKGNGESFFEQLVLLNKFVCTEWVEQGDKSKFYKRIGSRVLVILNNASYHKRQDIIERIEQSLPSIQRVFITSLQPRFRFNLISMAFL